MPSDSLRIENPVRLDRGRLLIGLSGWMDGGDISTGTIDWLAEQADADPIASIDPENFYIYNFPGSMEVSAIFRPHVELTDGLLIAYEPPDNVFYADTQRNLLLFEGKEPHMNWRGFGDAILKMAKESGVEEIYFIGSVAGMVPHTREPRITAAVSDPEMKVRFATAGIGFTNYEGPGSFINSLLDRAPQAGIKLASLVVEIPAYIQGRNPKGIQLVMRKLSALLELDLEAEVLRDLSDQWEKRIDEAVKERTDLGEHIQKLEEDYDHQVFDTQMGDLKAWLEQQGIQVD